MLGSFRLGMGPARDTCKNLPFRSASRVWWIGQSENVNLFGPSVGAEYTSSIKHFFVAKAAPFSDTPSRWAVVTMGFASTPCSS